jgi:hydroxymethylpyrimidine/phosphomethylpyrimidine kinase
MSAETREPRTATPSGSVPAPRTRVVLSIAGSDSGGGAGVQADLRAFARCGVHGACAITAVTAQNTVGVRAIHAVPPEVVLAQARAVIGDLGVDAAKVGMLASAALAKAAAQILDELAPGTPVVVDPVMAASSDASLLEDAAVPVLLEQIVPRATVLTPNLPEARVLVAQSGIAVRNGDEDSEARQLLLALAGLGARAVVLTGGHRARAVDLFLEGGAEGTVVEISGERHRDGADHGSGCTHSAVLAAELALGRQPLAAARRARELTGLAIAQGLREVGAGAGPVDVLGIAHLRPGPT